MIDHKAMREYWTAPTGAKDAPPGLVEYAALCVNLLADEIEHLNRAVKLEELRGERYREAYARLLARVLPTTGA